MSDIISSFRAVLFDFDGTLADSYEAITASVNHVRSLFQLPPLTIEEVKPNVGHGHGALLNVTVGRGETAANVAAYRAHHPSVMLGGTRLLPGVREMLPVLKQRGMLLGVCSNKPVYYTRDLLTHLGVRAYFDVVLGPEDVARPKPAPDMLLTAMERLKVKASETLYVGDMTIDIETARAAEVVVWVVPTGSDTEEKLVKARPDRVVKSLGELQGSVLGRP